MGPASSALVGVSAAPGVVGAGACAGAGAGGAGEEVLFSCSWYPLLGCLLGELMLLLLSVCLLVEAAAFGVLQPLSLPYLEPARSSDSGMMAVHYVVDNNTERPPAELISRCNRNGSQSHVSGRTSGHVRPSVRPSKEPPEGALGVAWRFDIGSASPHT